MTTPPSSDETQPGVTREALAQAFDTLLTPERFKDYGPNGLQVEGRATVRTLVSGVTASLALIDAAIETRADAILVHHGLFWRGQDRRVTGWMKQRLARLLQHDINLFAFHLPLDAHETLGNNAQLAKVLGFKASGPLWQRFGEQGLGLIADATVDSVEALVHRVQYALGRTVVCVNGLKRPLRRVAWCTGGAQSYFEDAMAAGADAFITGEISEPQAHLARECGVAYLACGHHATERYGAPAVAAEVAQELGLMHHFIDIDNPA